MGDFVFSPKFGKGVIVRLNTAWDVEVLYEKNVGSILYYGMAWGHNIKGDNFEPELYLL